MSRLLIYCDGGFGNRYNSLISGLAAAEILGYQPEIYWPISNWCEAEYSELFGNKTNVNTTNLIDLKGGVAGKWLVMSHDNSNAEYLDVPFVSAYGFSSEADFLAFCLKDGRDIFFYPALIPPYISQDRLRTAAAKLPLHHDLIDMANQFIEKNFPAKFYGIHLRRTDLVLGYTDAEVGEIVTGHPEEYFFVCSDSAESEKVAVQYQNVRVHDKQSYVGRQIHDKSWTEITLDTSKRAYRSNIMRNAQSVKDAVIDLLILSRSSVVGNSGSTFLNVARMIKEFTGDDRKYLPNIDTIPIEESFRRASIGVLDVMQAISAAQQLWMQERYDRAIALLRLWLKHPNSPQNQHVIFYNLSVYLQHMESFHESEACLRQCVYQQPEFIQGHLQLGLLLEKLGRPEEAVNQWLSALFICRDTVSHDPSLRAIIVSNVSRLTQKNS